ncbi:MAG: protein kinase [Oscillatoria sp. PMC 1068.18]|nr:protein kinase [Oscillatoria sp. PMC 1068.18]
MLGKLLDGRYQIVQRLSSGGFGDTYIAEDTRRPGNPQCVVKHLLPTNSDPNYLAIVRRLFNNEAEILEKLGEHPQIPQLLAYFEAEEEFYLVQQLIIGHTLTRELIPNQPWTESAVIELLKDVLTIFQFVHSYNVIHRDLKPDNFLRRKQDGKLFLIDFGSVKQIREPLNTTQANLNPNTVVVGTLDYMAAEQKQGNPQLNSDIYSLGLIAIQALTGIYPKQLKQDSATGEIVWEPQTKVSNLLIKIIQKMVAYDYRKDRYQTASEILAEFESVNVSIPDTVISLPPEYNPELASNLTKITQQKSKSVPDSTTNQKINSEKKSAVNNKEITQQKSKSAPNLLENSETEKGTQSNSEFVSKSAKISQPLAQSSALSKQNQSKTKYPLSRLYKILFSIQFLPLAGTLGLIFFNADIWLILLGVFLIAIGIGLFFLRSLYPQIARIHDSIFGVTFLISGGMLLFQNPNLRMEVELSEFLIAAGATLAVAEVLRVRKNH